MEWRWWWSSVQYEPVHDKTQQNDLRTQSDQSLRCLHEETLGP